MPKGCYEETASVEFKLYAARNAAYNPLYNILNLCIIIPALYNVIYFTAVKVFFCEILIVAIFTPVNRVVEPAIKMNLSFICNSCLYNSITEKNICICLCGYTQEMGDHVYSKIVR